MTFTLLTGPTSFSVLRGNWAEAPPFLFAKFLYPRASILFLRTESLFYAFGWACIKRRLFHDRSSRDSPAECGGAHSRNGTTTCGCTSNPSRKLHVHSTPSSLHSDCWVSVGPPRPIDRRHEANGLPSPLCSSSSLKPLFAACGRSIQMALSIPFPVRRRKMEDEERDPDEDLSLSFSPRDLLNHSDEKDVLTVGGESFRLRVDNGSGGGELELYEVEGRKGRREDE